MKITCALCLQEKDNKKNTHYLTDKIIRSCLNQDGENEREKGLYYDISNISSDIPVGFQRNTTPERIEKALGRGITNEDIEKSKNIPFSVNTVFCKNCEDIFTAIEAEFINKILPEFRENDLTNLSQLENSENGLIRLFFLLQVWRTAVCIDSFTIADSTKEELRKIILSPLGSKSEELVKYPLSITYLQTLGGDEEFTRNAVGPTCDNKQPRIIFFNDFIIQFYEKKEDIQFDSFYGLNNEKSYRKFINIDEEKFVFQILSDKERRDFLERKDTVKMQKIQYSNIALELWKQNGRNKWIYLLNY